MSLAVVLMIIGVVLAFGAWVFAVINMVRGVTKKDPFSGFGGTFKRHAGAAIVIFFGGLLFLIGMVLAIVDVLSHLTKQ